MPILSVFWQRSSAEDIHLIPGMVGPRLDHLLAIEHTAGNRRADAPPAGVTVAFAANFTAGPGTAGVAVNAQGEVTVTPPLPAPPRLLDFLVVATVTEGAASFTAYKRFHIHGGITRMWLTPATLTVRKAVRRSRLTLLAEFDDGTYGDLTAWCPEVAPAAADRTYVRRTGSTDPAIAWSTSAGGTVGVDSGTGLLTGAANAGTATITAALRPLPSPPATTGTGTARAARPWNDPVTLTPIDGPGFGAMASAPNILILPDGFTAAERPAFERLARELVTSLRTRRRTRPYDLVRDRLNYFMAWVESREGGITPLEVIRRSNVVGTRAEAREVDTAIAPGAVAAAWRVAAPPAPAANDRFLINDRDTAFAVVLGDRPKAQRFRAMRASRVHPSRFDEQDLDDFLGALRNAAGAAVGGVWARGGKDQDRLVVLARSNRTGGSNAFRSPTGRLITMTLDEEDLHRIEDAAGGRGKDLRPDPIPAHAHIDIWTTAAHELGHSMTLQDEYGGGGTLPATRLADVAAHANVQARSTLLTGGNLDADKVKWRWPRIQKAGVLTAMPFPVGATFRVPLEPGHAALFAVDDVVRFRLRPLLTAPPPTDRFIVTAVADPELDVQPLTAAPFVPGNFPAGSVLIAPTRARDPNPAGRVFGDDLELMHASIRARINAERNPLNAADADPPNRACTGAPLATPTRATNFPDDPAKPGIQPLPPNPPKYSSWIVGLYENGVTFDCDVYRPTGVCIMRTLHYEEKAQGQAYEFCPVCRYAMVDLLDPSKHGAIDSDYALRYPR